MTDNADQDVFRAELRPYRSLSRRSTTLVIAFLCCVNFAITLLFWHLGAWPVAGFNGAELGLALLLLQMHRRANRRIELVLLSPQRVLVRRTDEEGRQRDFMLPNHWLNVVVEERAGRVPALVLCTGGRQLEIAAALGEAEKRDLACALREAVHRLRNPVFDNPQLRESAAG